MTTLQTIIKEEREAFDDWLSNIDPTGCIPNTEPILNRLEKAMNKSAQWALANTNLTIKTIEHKGIKVTYEIDFDRKTVSLIERDGNNWKPKRWTFNDRKPEYLSSWMIIMEAMQEAVRQAKLELDLHIEKETDALTKKVLNTQQNKV